MRKASIAAVAVVVAVVGVVGALRAQQKYPAAGTPKVVLENEDVVVQRVVFEAGKWVGEHSHDGDQLVVVLEPMKMVYKEKGKERTVDYKAGDVFWVDEITHDHKAMTKGTAILVTLK